MKKDPDKKRLVLLDAHAIIHRAYHALPDFATSRGEPTGALYGLVSMVLKIVQELKPDYIIACYDLPKPTYRHEVYEGYKKGRVKTDDNLVLQLEKSKALCGALNIPIYSKEGFEADDVLGTIVESMKEQTVKGSIDIVVASGDMDTLQLVDEERVKVYTLKKGINDTILYNQKSVQERFGFAPKLLPDYKGLRGDPSDNIIGIQGIGEKTATELIKNFGSIENIYKVLKKNPSKIEKSGIKSRIMNLLKEGEEEAKFSLMLATIRRDVPIDFTLPLKKWKEGMDLEKAKQLFLELEFRTMHERLKSTLLKVDDSTPLNSKDKKTKQNSEIVETGDLSETEIAEIKVALWILNSNITNPKIEDILNFTKTDSLKKAKEIIFEKISTEPFKYVFENIEKPIIPVLKKMKERGVLVDKYLLDELHKKYSIELKALEKDIWIDAGEEFNVASPKQLGEILFNKMNLGVKNQKKTSTGAFSTKESELEKMVDSHPIILKIFEHREISKLISTYIKPIPTLVDKDSRLHADFIQTGSTTGRMSSENPNLQNIPISSQRGLAIRRAFMAPKGFSLVALDYSQIELRIAAILSKDQRLIDVFKDGGDAHRAVASMVFDVPKEEVTKEMRRQAKVINFGILYGMGVNALKTNLGSDRKTAQEFLNAYFEKFSGLANYLEKSKEGAFINGYTQTIFGRRRYFEGIKSRIPFIRASAERMAINAPIQGTQADIIKIAMKRIYDLLNKEKMNNKAYLILQIHDELVFEVDYSIIEEFIPKVKFIMENILTLDQTLGVPIIVNSAIGPNWAQLE